MRRRVVVLTVTAAVIAIAMFGVPLAAVVAKYLVDDERAELERAADLAALTISADLARGRHVALPPMAEEGIDLAFYGTDGSLRLGGGPAAGDAVVDTARGGTIGTGTAGGQMVIAVPVADDGVTVGVLRASTPLAESYLRIGAAWLLMVALATVATAATWLTSRRQAARLAAPLERLADTARALGDGDFSVRAQRAGVPEFDAVAAALDTTARRLGDVLARERAFSADASHQLRTPVAGLRLGLEATLAGDGATWRAAVETAIARTDRLERTIDDLITLARDARPAGAPLDLDELLHGLREEWHGPLAAAGRPLRIALPPDPPAAVASTAAVRQVLNVLVDNAVRHGRGTVTVAVRDLETALAFDVTDESPGVTLDSEELFVRRSERAAGSGIGLALARTLAEAEGGRLTLSRPSPPTFTLLLRARDVPDGRPHGAGPPHEGSRERSPS